MQNQRRVGQRVLTIMGAVALVAFGEIAVARQATLDDAGSAWSSSDRIEIAADGTYVETSILDAEILNEMGRSRDGTMTLHYNTAASTMRLLEAWSTAHGKRSVVGKKFIEDRPVASNVTGFDANNRITVAYPNAEVGSHLHLKYTKVMKDVPVNGHFDEFYTYGDSYLERASDLTVVSKLPLHILKNDPTDALAVELKPLGRGSQLTIHLRKPIYNAVVDEKGSYRDLDEVTWVAVSTSASTDDIVKAMAPGYDAVLAAPLPPSFQAIAAKAAKGADTIAKFDLVTSSLADEVRYMGDWRSVKGSYIARPLATIAETHFGDCKDFSASTAAILRALGFKANIALIHRGEAPKPTPALSMLAYNHAIVRAEADGKVFWIDPTNVSSFARGLYPDLIGRQALVIDGARPRQEAVPLPTPDAGRWVITKDLRFQPNGDAVIKAKDEATGSAATYYAGATRFNSRDHFDQEFRDSVVGNHVLVSGHIEPYDLSSRIVKDVTFNGRFAVSNYAVRSTAGLALWTPPPGLVSTIVGLSNEQRTSSFFLGAPSTLRYVTTVESADLVGQAPEACSVTSPWLDARREITAEDGKIVVTDQIATKQLLIPIAELRGKGYLALRDDLQKCLYSGALIFQPQEAVAE